MTEPEKMALTSLDIAEEKREELKRCLGSTFPEVFAEGSVDFEQLKRVLGEWVDPGKERFGLNWPGKAECMKIIQQPSVATLKPVREESVNFDETENLFIEGDNLEVLKLMQKAYFGKIKMIYIDPPYNTGNEFIYPDNYTESLETYLAYAGLVDNEGKKFSTNTSTEGRFHTKWLNMMYPRLYLARNLLREDGVIFISIDDNEVANLRKLCDEIWGEDNFIAQFVWQKKYSRDNRPLIGTVHEYILMYAKDVRLFGDVRNLLPPSEESLKVYKNPNNDPRGRWRPIPMTAQAGHATPSQFYEVVTPTGVKHKPPVGRCWSVSENRYKELLSEGRIYFGKDNSSQPNIIRYLDEIEGFVPWTWLPSKEVGHTDSAMKEFYGLMGKEAAFETPKPSELIKHFCMIALRGDDLVLDFFAGTATTAQVVLELNKETGGTRKFIAVQLPQPCNEDSDAFKAGYETIADIGKERIRRVIRKATEERQGELTLDAPKNIDFGFKLFKLEQSNFKVWDGNASSFHESGKQLEMHVDHLSPESSAEDVLYELLLKAGFPLTTKVKQLTLAGKEVFSIEDGALLICLEKEVTPELIDALVEAEPLQVICLDSAFKGNDQLKANAVQTFKARAQAEESEIVFKTV